MRKKYDAVATIGTYRTKAGEEKKKYLTCGAVFEGDDGRLSMKLDAIPASPEWTGWVAFYEPRDANGTSTHVGNSNAVQGRPDAHNRAKANAYQQTDDGDDIPF